METCSLPLAESDAKADWQSQANIEEMCSESLANQYDPPFIPNQMGKTVVRLPLGGRASTDPAEVQMPRITRPICLGVITVPQILQFDKSCRSPEARLAKPLNRLTNMVDASGTNKYTYTSGGLLATEDGPWTSDTVTSTYNNRMRTNLSLAQPTGGWTNQFFAAPK